MRVDEQEKTVHAGANLGEILQRERRERGFSLSEIAQATKISLTHLKSLESNDFKALPGGAFSKGFLRTYARHIGLDPEEMVNHYLFEIAGRSESRLTEDRLSPEEVLRGRQKRALLAAVVIVSLIALSAVLYFVVT
jgi:cytoskeleton protein RodZ